MRAAIAARRPLVLRRAASRWACVARWKGGAAALRARAGDARHPLRCFVSQNGQFFLDGTWDARAVLTASMSRDACLAELLDDDAPALRGWRSRYAVDDAFDARAPRGGLARDVPAYPSLLRAFGARARAVRRQLFVARGPTTTQLHRDAFDNLFVCCAGTRTWTLAHRAHDIARDPPDGVSARFQPPSAEGADDDADGSGGGETDDVGFARVVLAAGDALFLPSGWWHRVQGDGADPARTSAAINWYFEPPNEEDARATREPAPGPRSPEILFA